MGSGQTDKQNIQHTLQPRLCEDSHLHLYRLHHRSLPSQSLGKYYNSPRDRTLKSTANAIKVAQIQTQCMKTHLADNYKSADITSRSTDLANKGVARLKFKRRQPPLPSLLPSSFFFPPFPSPSFHFSLTTWGLSERCEKSDDQPIIISFYCDRSSKASCDLL